MEKMNIEVANKLFDGVLERVNRPESIVYKGFEVKVYTHVPFTELTKFIERVVYAGYSNGEMSNLYRDLEISRCIIDDLSNIPMPKIVLDDGNEIDDLNACYEIVFGQDGLVKLSESVDELVFTVQTYVNVEICELMKANSAHNKVMSKLLELYEYAKADVNDMLTNPVRIADMLSEAERFRVIE